MTGDGKTAVRGGAGVFYDRYNDDNILDLVELPPLLNTYTTNYTTIDGAARQPVDGDADGCSADRSVHPPTVYNWSAGVQRDIGWNLVGDAAYVGNAARKQLVDRPINGRPYGYAYQPSSLDPTNVVGGQPQPLPDDLLARTRVTASITQRSSTAIRDYHSLQFCGEPSPLGGRPDGRRGLHVPNREQHPRRDRPVRVATTARATTTRRAPAAHAVHQLLVRGAEPQQQMGQRLGQGAVVDNWQVSGITSMLSGTYTAFCTATPASRPVR